MAGSKIAQYLSFAFLVAACSFCLAGLNLFFGISALAAAVSFILGFRRDPTLEAEFGKFIDADVARREIYSDCAIQLRYGLIALLVGVGSLTALLACNAEPTWPIIVVILLAGLVILVALFRLSLLEAQFAARRFK